jgi:choline dehydrogenase
MYDYIVAGAGSAGCVMANRLSADAGKRVCLVEAGPPDKSPLIHIPLGLALLAKTRGIKWDYNTEPEPALNDRRLYWPRGRTLGGSSSVNAMIYMRGHPADYEGWAAAAGADWGWSRVRELFLAMENNEAQGGPHHGKDGPLNVANLRHPNPLSRAFVEAGIECQIPENADFNGASQEGVGLYQVTQKDGKRFSSARAFLDPVRDRANLTIETNALVERVLFQGRRAVGLQLRGRVLPLNPGGEVILCAGAVGSPHLLMLSGIGPGKELSRYGIEVVHDTREVGENLADHLDVGVLAATRGRDAIGVTAGLLPRVIRSSFAYARHKSGELTSNVAEAGGFVKSDPARERPNLQFHFLPCLLRDHGRRTAFGYGVTLHVCDLLPKSRGRISLHSADPAAPPKIEAKYLSHPDDIGVLLDGFKFARRVLDAPSMKKHIKAELSPGPQVQTDEALIADIRARAETIYHPVGSCRMGKDETSVVDPEARVRGVEGLRVVDASIMPSIIAGNTNAPVMMIAENVSRMMRGR